MQGFVVGFFNHLTERRKYMNFWSFFCGSIVCWNSNLLIKNNLQNLKNNSYIWLVDCLIKRTCSLRVLFENLDGFAYEK